MVSPKSACCIAAGAEVAAVAAMVARRQRWSGGSTSRQSCKPVTARKGMVGLISKHCLHASR